jgi:hypothetical protein
VFLLVAAILFFVSAFTIPVPIDLFKLGWGFVALALLFP